jgi:hypothetical protein
MRIQTAAATAALLSLILAAPAAAADSTPDTAPLSPGKPAGVRQAELVGPTLIWVVGIGLIVGGAIALSAGHGNSSSSTGTH